jgi:hypothetical protein
MSIRASRPLVAVAVAVHSFLAACGGGGGENAIPQSECGANLSPGFQDQVYSFRPPTRFGWCPMVLQGVTALSGTLIIDIVRSRNGNASGFIGSVEIWTKNIAQDESGTLGPDVKSEEEDISFVLNAPYTIPAGEPNAGEQPLRGQVNLEWVGGFLPATGRRELDSLDIRYPTNVGYPLSWVGTHAAGAFILTPIVRSSQPGTITGPSVVYPGTVGTFRVITHWDTTGYRYQWYLNGAALAGDSAATLSKTFTTVGTNGLRVDQLLVDGTALSSYYTVTVPLVAYISGPYTTIAWQNETWTASIPYGSAPFSYRWYVNGNLMSTASDLITSFAPNTSNLVRLEVTNSQGLTAVDERSVYAANENGCVGICP